MKSGESKWDHGTNYPYYPSSKIAPRGSYWGIKMKNVLTLTPNLLLDPILISRFSVSQRCCLVVLGLAYNMKVAGLSPVTKSKQWLNNAWNTIAPTYHMHYSLFILNWQEFDKKILTRIYRFVFVSIAAHSCDKPTQPLLQASVL